MSLVILPFMFCTCTFSETSHVLYLCVFANSPKSKTIYSGQLFHFLHSFHMFLNCSLMMRTHNRLRAKKGPAPPPLGNFADISYLEEKFKPHLLRDVCTLCSGALVSDSLLYMLLQQTKEKIKMKVRATERRH